MPGGSTPPAGQKSAKDLEQQEQEELALALALSQSEAEAKSKEVSVSHQCVSLSDLFLIFSVSA